MLLNTTTVSLRLRYKLRNNLQYEALSLMKIIFLYKFTFNNFLHQPL